MKLHWFEYLDAHEVSQFSAWVFSNGFSFDYWCNVNTILENSENIGKVEPPTQEYQLKRQKKIMTFHPAAILMRV